MEEGVAPTDSRRRPDQRLMEEGHWEESNQEKIRYFSIHFLQMNISTIDYFLMQT